MKYKYLYIYIYLYIHIVRIGGLDNDEVNLKCRRPPQTFGCCIPEQHAAAECSLEEQSYVYKMRGGDPLYSHIPGYKLFMPLRGPATVPLCVLQRPAFLNFSLPRCFKHLEAIGELQKDKHMKRYEECGKICKAGRDLWEISGQPRDFHPRAACGSRM